MRRFKKWCDEYDLDWLGVLVMVAFFVLLMVCI